MVAVNLDISLLYIQVTVLVATVIRLPEGTLGDLYTPVNVQIAGIYPSIVLLLVNHERSLDRTIFINSVAVNATGPDRSTRPAVDTSRAMSSVVFRSNPDARERTQTQTGASTETGIEHPSSSASSDGSDVSIHAEKEKSHLRWKGVPGLPAEAEPYLDDIADDVVEIKRNGLV